MVNGRVFYACLGVLVNKPGSGSTRFGRNDQEASEDVGDFLYLNGVQSVGVSIDFVPQYQQFYVHYKIYVSLRLNHVNSQ